MNRMELSRAAYLSLGALCTDLILATGATLVLWPTGLLSRFPMGFVALLLVWKALASGVVMLIGARWQFNDKLLAFNGFYMGRIVGLLLGVFVGEKYAGAAGAVILAAVLYFLVSRAGRRLGLAVDAQGRRLGLYTETPPVARPLELTGKWAWLPYAYSLGVSVAMGAIAAFFTHSGISVADSGGAYLPKARLVVIALSLVAILSLWFTLARASRQPQRDPSSFRMSLLLIGVAASSAPAIYAIVLLIAFGASLTEALVFNVAGLIAGLWWIGRVRRFPVDKASD